MPAQKRKLDDSTAAEGQTSSRPTSSNDTHDKMSDTQTTRPETRNVSIFNSPVVTIAVGPNKIQHIVHEKILARAQAGQFFNKAFTNGFQETQTRHLELPEDDPDTFEFFIKWLYGTCCLDDLSAIGNLLQKTSSPQKVRYYIFAHKYLIDALQDGIMSELYDLLIDQYWWRDDFNRASLEQLVASVHDSHMHRLLARWFVHDALAGDTHAKPRGIALKNLVDDLPEEFLRLVTEEMFRVEIDHEFDQVAILGQKSGYLKRRRCRQNGSIIRRDRLYD